MNPIFPLLIKGCASSYGEVLHFSGKIGVIFRKLIAKDLLKISTQIFFLFKNTSFYFKSVCLQIFKHEFRDLGTSLKLSLPKTTWVSLLYHIDQLGYLKSKNWNIFLLRPVLAMIGRARFSKFEFLKFLYPPIGHKIRWNFKLLI